MRRSAILADDVVMTVRLPLPMDGIAILADTVARVFGTGDSMLRFEDDQISIVEPAAGFGPRKTTRRKAPTDSTDEIQITHALLTEEGLSVRVEDAKERVVIIADSMRLWFETVGATNYVEQQITAPGENAEFIFTLQKAGNPTAHQLRERAEEHLGDALDALGEAEVLLSGMAGRGFDEVELARVRALIEAAREDRTS